MSCCVNKTMYIRHICFNKSLLINTQDEHIKIPKQTAGVLKNVDTITGFGDVGSDGEPEYTDNAVHRLVLPSHCTASCWV